MPDERVSVTKVSCLGGGEKQLHKDFKTRSYWGKPGDRAWARLLYPGSF